MEEKPEYEILEGSLAACLACGATVHFRYMALHSTWHENQVSENPPLGEGFQ